MMQTHRDKADHETWGLCTVCRKVIIYGDRWAHAGHMIDTSWNAMANPDNTPWFPGYRFYCEQDSGARRKGFRAKGHTRMTPRVYKVEFEITEDGKVRHTRGPKPTDELQASVEAMYLRERPGSNWYPGCEGL